MISDIKTNVILFMSFSLLAPQSLLNYMGSQSFDIDDEDYF